MQISFQNIFYKLFIDVVTYFITDWTRLNKTFRKVSTASSAN